MKFTGYKNFNLIPIGNVSFSFKRKTKVNGTKVTISVSELHILHDTDVNIDKETEKALMKEMKTAKSDLLTDGTDFFTTRGNKITQIKHHLFYTILNDAEYKQKIHELRFG